MTDRFDIRTTALEAVLLIERKPRGDRRGFLERMFCVDELATVMGARAVVQINRTLTEKRGTVRGLHYQNAPHAEAKLVSCLRGEIFDVAVDLRRGSPTFLRWHAERLSRDNHRSMFIPEGFAHGFQSLTDDCELLYIHTAAYAADAEAGLDALDPRLAIEWPEPIMEQSTRDRAFSRIDAGFAGLVG